MGEDMLIGLLGAAAMVIVGLTGLCGVMVKRDRKNNHPSNPARLGVQPCMEGGSLLGEFRVYVEGVKDDTREMRGKMDTLINLVGKIEGRLPRL